MFLMLESQAIISQCLISISVCIKFQGAASIFNNLITDHVNTLSLLLSHNHLDIFFLIVREYWLGIAKPKNVFESILNPSIKNYEILKISYFLLTDLLTLLILCLLDACLLTYLLMSSDKHNSRTARARDLIYSLINVAWSQDVPFHQPQQLQCLHYGTYGTTYLCAPVLSLQSHKVTICGYSA